MHDRHGFISPCFGLFFGVLGASLTACGGGTGAQDAGGSLPDGAHVPDSPTSVLDAPLGDPRCEFVLVGADGSRRDWSAPARARMNGSGNLLVVCELGDEEIRLSIGNATFNGPRTYRMDDFTDDGSIVWVTEDGSWSSFSDDGNCVLDLAVAEPLNTPRNEVRDGGRVAGTFQCAALIGGSRDPNYSIEAGSFAATVE